MTLISRSTIDGNLITTTSLLLGPHNHKSYSPIERVYICNNNAGVLVRVQVGLRSYSSMAEHDTITLSLLELNQK